MTTWDSVGSGWWPMQGTSWPVRQSMPASRSMLSRLIWRRWLGGQVEVFEGDAGERAVGAGLGDGGDVEQRGVGARGVAGVGHGVLLVGRVRRACAVRGRRRAGR